MLNGHCSEASEIPKEHFTKRESRWRQCAMLKKFQYKMLSRLTLAVCSSWLDGRSRCCTLTVGSVEGSPPAGVVPFFPLNSTLFSCIRLRQDIFRDHCHVTIVGTETSPGLFAVETIETSLETTLSDCA